MLTVVIQAGGESRRMGQDKGLAPFLGTPLIERVFKRLSPIADDLFVVTQHPEQYSFLGAPLVHDKIPGRGALGGLYTALSLAKELPDQAVAVIACDMPFASPALIQYQYNLLLQNGVDVVIPGQNDRVEPFHAVYRRRTCLPAVEAAIQAGKWRADSWFQDVQIHYLSREEVLRFDPLLRAFLNVNTPDELRQAERLAEINNEETFDNPTI